MRITEKQSELWKLSDSLLKKIGGFAGISRSPDSIIREKGRTEGTREWALLKSAGLASGILDDNECQYLIDCIRK